MTSSEKFCLKWNDFQKNVTSSFREIREDFCDVTLAGEGKQTIRAHKVILAASSNFFRDILKENQHPHPLLYLRGIKASHLASVVDFMYHGEVNIFQEDLDDFLSVAEELQLKGLTGNETENKNDAKVVEEWKLRGLTESKEIGNGQDINHMPQPTRKTLTKINEDKAVVKMEHGKKQNNYSIYEKPENREMAIVNPNASHEELDAKINTMITNYLGQWSCLQCGKVDKKKSNLINHIEGKHIEGITHPCNQCGKLFRYSNSHVSTNQEII